MTIALPKKTPYRLEHTGVVAQDRAQRTAQQVASAHEQTKAIVAALMNTAYGALTTNVSIGVAAYVTLVQASITTVLSAGHIDITFTASGANSTATANARFLVLVDGVSVGGTYGFTNAGDTFCAAIVVRASVTRGSHVITVQWKSDAGAARINAATIAEEHAHVLVREAL